MQAIFCRRANLASLLLRTVTWSSWSHCAIVTPEGTVIEAAAPHGVIERSRATFLAGVSKFSEKTIDLPDDAAAIAWARAQIGKPYDWLGALGLAFHREWDNPERWWCSELVEGAAAAGRRPRFVSNAGRVTPQHSWMVA
jgi:uncharacterized protein YycO